MPFRDSLLDNFAGDLEYHPRRGAFYLVLAAVAFCFFYFQPAGNRFTATSLVFAFGALTLLVKGVFLFRKSSEGLGLSESDLKSLSGRKNLRSIPSLAAQVVQDFGAGPLLLGPVLRVFADSDSAWSRATELQIFLAGLILFGLGWILRRATSAPSIGATDRS